MNHDRYRSPENRTANFEIKIMNEQKEPIVIGNSTDEGFQSAPACYLDLKDKLDLAESECQDIRNHTVKLADALMDVNNITGHDGHVKKYIERVDTLMREYTGLEIK